MFRIHIVLMTLLIIFFRNIWFNGGFLSEILLIIRIKRVRNLLKIINLNFFYQHRYFWDIFKLISLIFINMFLTKADWWQFYSAAIRLDLDLT